MKLHFVGIGGVGVGSLAQALVEAGHEVTGSDKALYEPMKSVLKNAKVQLFEGYSADRANSLSPELVVIGNVISKENVEAQAWMRTGIPFISFPEAVRKFLIDNRKSVVVAGTHGKTTTTSWISFLAHQMQADPSYLIGGVPHDLPSNSKVGRGNIFIGEGDEYDSAFFDKGPKFLHYAPDICVINSIEFDHADIYRDLEHVRSSFEKLVAILPGDGVCIGRFEDPVVMDVLGDALCTVETFGANDAAMWKISGISESEAGYKFEIRYKSKSLGEFTSPMFGVFNLMNIVAGVAVGINLGFAVEKIRSAVPLFTGVRRRQQILSTSPIRLIDDFAHHPTEVLATLLAVRQRYKQGKVFALFEPRSATARRQIHQEEYPKSFAPADVVFISVPFKAGELSQGDRFSSEKLVEDLKAQGKTAYVANSTEEILNRITELAKPQDSIVVLSNGEFDKIQEKILKAF